MSSAGPGLVSKRLRDGLEEELISSAEIQETAIAKGGSSTSRNTG